MSFLGCFLLYHCSWVLVSEWAESLNIVNAKVLHGLVNWRQILEMPLYNLVPWPIYKRNLAACITIKDFSFLNG
jgi:hypothetical protein